MHNQEIQSIYQDLEPFRYLLCVDLEATCDEIQEGDHSRALVVKPSEMETIEIGLVVIDLHRKQKTKSFQSFVRPHLHPVLTPFCKQLTTIAQRDIDSAPSFTDAMQRLRDFISAYDDVAWASWGSYDAVQIQRDGAINQCSAILESIPHFNVKNWVEYDSGQRPSGLKPCIEKLGIVWDGTYHRGIDDAKNVASLVLQLLDSSTQ
ncbi:exonuclease domain-containing protein [Pseudomonas saxonica]|uniref:Exonuclease domain-containing protein n=1 Tax=Pseudomonas saxonica TaxID=2600598 RepID=A0ABY3GHC5_9PSED|nr:3'-5' exonuclease [Pseudomonas saxonica]TWR89827.1 exonuclease domain-containing protein [Pseudomonas saxonica]